MLERISWMSVRRMYRFQNAGCFSGINASTNDHRVIGGGKESLCKVIGEELPTMQILT